MYAPWWQGRHAVVVVRQSAGELLEQEYPNHEQFSTPAPQVSADALDGA